MKIEEFNEKLLKEIIICKEENILTDGIQELYIKLIKIALDSKRYVYLTPIIKNKCEMKACFTCYKFVLNINLEKSVNIYLYANTIIRSSFSHTIRQIHREKHESKST